MSNQSGISCTTELIDSFKEYIDTNGRSLIVKIEKEALVPGHLIQGTSDLSHDWSLIHDKLSDKESAFIIVNKESNGEHVFISYTPDLAPVRDKMIYASSKNSILRELGIEFFKPILFINDLDEISAQGWKLHLAHEGLANPLTEEEESLQRVKEFERLHVGTERKSKLINDDNSSTGFMFHVDDDLKLKLKSLSNNELISCSIDFTTESIKLSQDTNFSKIDEIITKISNTEPQYTVLKVNDKVSFIYSCPSGSKVKERMIYASNKLSFINQLLIKELNLTIANTIEVGDLDEIEMSKFESGDVKVDTTSSNLRFSRPKGPRRK